MITSFVAEIVKSPVKSVAKNGGTYTPVSPFVGIVDAVSYTHLDVYKRQEEGELGKVF